MRLNWLHINCEMQPVIFISMINQPVQLLVNNHLAAQEQVVQMIKQVLCLILYRWLSARTIKETFVPPTDYRYPFLRGESEGI